MADKPTQGIRLIQLPGRIIALPRSLDQQFIARSRHSTLIINRLDVVAVRSVRLQAAVRILRLVTCSAHDQLGIAIDLIVLNRRCPR